MPGVDPLTSFAPSAVATGPAGQRRIDVVFAAPSNLWHLVYQEPDGWTPHWRKRGGDYKSAVSVCAFSGGRLDTFGLGNDGHLYHATGLSPHLDGAGFWPTDDLGHPDGRTIISSPAGVAYGPTGLAAVVRTARDTNHAPGIWFVELETGGLPGTANWNWRPHLIETWPHSPGAVVTSGPGLTWRAPGVFDLAVIDTFSQLRHSQSPDVWEVFDGPREGTLTSSPSMTFWHEPALPCVHIATCFGPTPLEPGAVVVKSWLGEHWTPQRLIFTNGDFGGRGVLGPPALTSWGEPRLDVFFLTATDVAGGNLALTHGWWEGPGNAWHFENLPAPPVT